VSTCAAIAGWVSLLLGVFGLLQSAAFVLHAMAMRLEALTEPRAVEGAVWCNHKGRFVDVTAARPPLRTHSGSMGPASIVQAPTVAATAAAASTADGIMAASLSGWVQRLQQKGQAAVVSARAHVAASEAGETLLQFRGEAQEVGRWTLENAQKGVAQLGETLPPQMRRAIRSSFSAGPDADPVRNAHRDAFTECLRGTISTDANQAHLTRRSSNCIKGKLSVPQDNGYRKDEAPKNHRQTPPPSRVEACAVDRHHVAAADKQQQATAKASGMQEGQRQPAESEWHAPQPRKIKARFGKTHRCESAPTTKVAPREQFAPNRARSWQAGLGNHRNDKVLRPLVRNKTKERRPVSGGHAEQHEQRMKPAFSFKQLREKTTKLQKFMVQHADSWADAFAQDKPPCMDDSPREVRPTGKRHRLLGSDADATRQSQIEKQILGQNDNQRGSSVWNDAQRWLESNSPQNKKQSNLVEEVQWDEEDTRQRKYAKWLKEWRRQREEDAELLEKELTDLRRMREEEMDAYERVSAVQRQGHQQKDLELEANKSRLTSSLPSEGRQAKDAIEAVQQLSSVLQNAAETGNEQAPTSLLPSGKIGSAHASTASLPSEMRQASTSSLASEGGQAKVRQLSDASQDAAENASEQALASSLPSETGKANEVKEAVRQLSDGSQDAVKNASEQASTSLLPSERGQAKEVNEAVWQPSDALQDAAENASEQALTSSLPSETGQANEVKKAVRQPCDALHDAAETGTEQTWTSSLPSDRGHATEVKEAVQQPSDALQDAAETGTEQALTSSMLSKKGRAEEVEEAVQQLSNPSLDAATTGSGQTEGSCQLSRSLSGTCMGKEAGPESHESVSNQHQVKQLQQEMRSASAEQLSRADGPKQQQQQQQQQPHQVGRSLSFGLEDLQDKKTWLKLGVEPAERETYLSPEDFQEVFKMDKESFAKLPKWKRDNLKKRALLF